MKGFRSIRLLGLITATALLWSASFNTHAAGTASGTTVSNQATLDYSIGSVAQPQASSNTTTFLVDNKVDLTVTANGNATVIPGSNDQVLPFTLTNTGNTTQGYVLTAVGGTSDQFDMSSVRIYADVNNNGTYESGTDTLYTASTNVGDIVAGGSKNVLIVANTPASTPDNQTAQYDLVATTTNAGTATLTTQDTNADNPSAVQVVFADGSGTSADGAVRNGKYAATGTYTVDTATLSVVKSSTVISDPFNNTTNPKAIPGAVVRYTITVTNSGKANATGAAIQDQIPANTTFVTGSLTVTNSNGAVTPVREYSTTGATYSTTETSPVGFIRVTNSSIRGTTAGAGANGTATVTFDVTIN